MYDFYVRASCGGGIWSDWSLKAAQTVCGAVTQFPYQEGFDSVRLNPCWTITTPRVGLGWKLERDTFLSHDIRPFNGRGYLRVQQNPGVTFGDSYKLLTPKFQLGSTPKQLIYHYLLPGSNEYGIDEPSVEISTDQTNWETLFKHNVFNSQNKRADV
jgi:hypothetical protein